MLSIVQGNWVPHFMYNAICCWSSKLEFCKSHTCSREHSRFPHRRSRTLDAHNQERRSSCVETAPQVSPCTALAAKLVASLGPRVQPSPASAITQAAAHLCALLSFFFPEKSWSGGECEIELLICFRNFADFRDLTVNLCDGRSVESKEIKT